MRILYTSTLAGSTEKLPTVGQLSPTWMKLEKHLSVQDNDSDFVKMVKATVWVDMQNRYKQPEVVDFLEEACALDPRFKGKLKNIEVWGRFETKVAALIQSQTPVQDVKVKVEQDTPASDSDSPDISQDEPQASTEDSTATILPMQNLKRKRSSIEELFDDDEDTLTITHTEAPPTPEVQSHLQIEQYRAMPGAEMDKNPLEFYKTNFESFPALALKYFSVSASSVPSERVFSLAGNTISQERVRIDPGKADMLIFLHKNVD